MNASLRALVSHQASFICQPSGVNGERRKSLTAPTRALNGGLLETVGRGIEVKQAVTTVNVQQRLNVSVNITLHWSATGQRNRTHCVEYEQKTLS